MKKSQSSRSFGVNIPVSPMPKTPEGRKRCGSCEQTFKKSAQKCPHCKALYNNVSLTLDTSDDFILTGGVKAPVEDKTEHVRALFQRAMDIRYKEPVRSRELFYEVIQMDPAHNEARLKISWLEIKFGRYSYANTVLGPVVASTKATIEQKQRAYNNLAASKLFDKEPDFALAEKLAQKGIDLNGIGTVKLWENFALAVKEQGRLIECRDAFTKALTLDPTSVHSSKSLKEVERLIKKASKKSKTGENEKVDILADDDKENSFNRPKPTITRSTSLKKLIVTNKSKSRSKVLQL